MESMDPMVQNGFALVGMVMVAKVAVFILSSFYKTFLRPARSDLKKLGDWAVVTGATDGIGKAYSFELAKRGLNVLLISRTEAKLQAVQEEILTKYKDAKVQYLVCDYSKFTHATMGPVQKALEGLDGTIGILINNVGVSYRYPRYFHELPDEEVQNLMTMNIDSTVWMTRMVLKGMVDRKKGAIVNISSAAARNTAPLLTEYSASKSFIEKLSLGLNAEYSVKGDISIQCQVPFFVATKLAKMRKSISVPTPKEYVDVAIKWVGYPDPVVNPFWIHAVMGYVMNSMPAFLMNKITTDMHVDLRRRGLKKDAKLAAEAKTD